MITFCYNLDMGPTIVLKCKENYESYKFEDRTIQLDASGTPSKVGRSQGNCLKQ